MDHSLQASYTGRGHSTTPNSSEQVPKRFGLVRAQRTVNDAGGRVHLGHFKASLFKHLVHSVCTRQATSDAHWVQGCNTKSWNRPCPSRRLPTSAPVILLTPMEAILQIASIGDADDGVGRGTLPKGTPSISKQV